jgi:dTDP-4-amino-4,6-dideoxygalactose transaminase
MNVPILDTVRSHADIKQDVEEAALRVLRGGQYVLGQEVSDFESACAEYIGVDHAIGVSSGTDALILAMMALGIGPGDEVICPSFTFFATAGAISRVGATPVFVDIFADCFTIDTAAVQNAITENTKAIIPVHLFGHVARMDRLNSIASEHGLHVIEDAAQSIGCELEDVQVGGLGTIGCFSFFPSKNLGGYGDAGLITTNDSALAEEARCLRVHGGQGYVHERIGGNFRIDALQAAMLAVKLQHLPRYETRRSENADTYQARLSGIESITLPQEVRGKHVYNQYTIRVLGDQRDALKDYLQEQGISTGIYYPLPLHQQQCFQDVVPEGCGLQVTEELSQECLSLPIAAELNDEEISYVAEKILDFPWS